MVLSFIKKFDDFAASMANPPTDRPLAAAAAMVGRAACDAISARPDLLAPTFLQSPLIWACQPYWDSQGYSAPEEVSPFTGGQCATVYSVQGVFASAGSAGNNQGWGPANVNGPISGIVSRPPTSGSPDRVDLWVVSGPGPDVRVVQDTFTEGLSFSITQVTRNDGQPDDCGNPPGSFEPGPTPAPDPGPPPPGVGPSFDIRGNPIFVLPPTLEVSPNLNVEVPIGEFNLGFGGGANSAIAPLPTEENPGAGSGAGGGDNDFGDPPDGERWAGCCVRITGLPPGSGNIPQAEPESIYPRTIGNVRLRFAGSDGLSAYDTPLVNRQRTTCVWEPVRGLNPTGVRVNLLPGFSYAFTPYSIPLEQ